MGHARRVLLVGAGIAAVATVALVLRAQSLRRPSPNTGDAATGADDATSPPAEEPPETRAGSLVLRVTGRDTGQTPPDVRVCVVDARARVVVARDLGDGSILASRDLRAGDVLRVWAPGHDVATQPITGDSPPAQVVLVPSAGRQMIRIVDGATGGPIEADVSVVHATPGAWTGVPSRGDGASPEFDHRVVRIPPAGAWVSVPAGLATSVQAGANGSFAYPWFQMCHPGGDAEIRVERLRSLPILCDGSPVGSRGEIEAWFVPDRVQAVAGDPLRAASLTAVLDTRLPAMVAVRKGACVLDGVPPVAGALFGRIRDRPFAVQVGPTDSTIDLDSLAPVREITAEPRLGGVPLGAGGLVAPGRLDWTGAAALASLSPGRVRGAFVRRDAQPWAPVSLPESEWLTLWHPERGLAHVRWDAAAEAAGPIEGAPFPGSIEITADGPGPFAAWIIAWPVKDADRAGSSAGELVSRPAVHALRRECADVTRVVLRGLPLGRWRCDYGAADAGRRPPDDVQCEVVTLTADAPEGRVVMRRRR